MNPSLNNPDIVLQYPTLNAPSWIRNDQIQVPIFVYDHPSINRTLIWSFSCVLSVNYTIIIIYYLEKSNRYLNSVENPTNFKNVLHPDYIAANDFYLFIKSDIDKLNV